MTIRSNIISLDDKKNLNLLLAAELNNIGLTKELLLTQNLKDIAKEYAELENLKKSFSDIILKNFAQLDFTELVAYKKYFIKESCIKKEVAPSNIGGLKVVSVDGSYVVKKFLNVDFSFLKAIAVRYYFIKNHDARIKYFPDLNGFNNFLAQGNYLNCEENYVDAQVSLDMTFMEISLLNKLIENTKEIDIIIIDGSVVIMPINYLFSKDPHISKKYDRLLKEYHKLYLNCREYGILLIGSIKDTRTSALTHLLRDSIQLLKPSHSNLSDFIKLDYRQVFKYFSDLDLFNRLLSKFERSCIFQCKRDIDKIRNTGIKKEIPYYFPFVFYAFYLKTAKYDTPCRIEFFMEEKHDFKKASEKADLISSLLLPISSLNEYYGLPIPQIEAHRRAVFKPQELNLLFNNLKRNLNKYGVNLIEKRRNRRPF